MRRGDSVSCQQGRREERAATTTCRHHLKDSKRSKKPLILMHSNTSIISRDILSGKRQLVNGITWRL